MLIPFDMIAVMLCLGYFAEQPNARPIGFGQGLWSTLAAGAALFAFGMGLSTACLAWLRRKGFAQRGRIAAIADITLRVVLTVVFAAVLEHTDLPWTAGARMGLAQPRGSFLFQFIGLAVYVCLFMLAWLPVYRLHRKVNSGTWTLGQYLLHKVRYNLFIIAAWVPFALVADWLADFLALTPALLFLSAWVFPWILTHLWGCKPLTDAALLADIAELERKSGARFSRVYLWEPGGGAVQNAAAVGIFPPFRYLFITPALVRGMSRDEFKAVILHELGHVRKRHLLFYLITSLAGLNLAVLGGSMIPCLVMSERFIIIGLLVVCYFRFVFGWLSRGMERQADLFSLQVSGSAAGLANALEKLAISAGHIRLASSWHHLGVAERTTFLRQAEALPQLAEWHNRRVSVVMSLGCVVSAAVLLCVGWLAAVPAPSPVRHEADPRQEMHWRRVMQILPGNAAAPLELAYSLAARPARQTEAAALAREVLRLHGSADELGAAKSLLRNLSADEME